MKHDVRIRSLSNCHTCFRPMAKVSFLILLSPVNRKEKRPQSASREPLTKDKADECMGKALQYLQCINSFSECHSSYSNSFHPSL